MDPIPSESTPSGGLGPQGPSAPSQGDVPADQGLPTDFDPNRDFPLEKPAEPTGHEPAGAEGQGTQEPAPTDPFVEMGPYRGPQSGLRDFLTKQQSEHDKLAAQGQQAGDFIRQLQDKIRQLSGETTAAAVAPVAPQAAPGASKADLWLTDAEKAEALLREEIKKETTTEISALRKELVETQRVQQHRTNVSEVLGHFNRGVEQIPNAYPFIPENERQAFTAEVEREFRENGYRYIWPDENGAVEKVDVMAAADIVLGRKVRSGDFIGKLKQSVEADVMAKLKKQAQDNVQVRSPAAQDAGPPSEVNPKDPEGLLHDWGIPAEAF